MIWCLKNTGANISQFDLKNEFIDQYIERIKKEKPSILSYHDFLKEARNLGMDEEEVIKTYHKLFFSKFT